MAHRQTTALLPNGPRAEREVMSVCLPPRPPKEPQVAQVLRFQHFCTQLQEHPGLEENRLIGQPGQQGRQAKKG